MSDILPPLSGPKVDKILGKGSVALITDETLLALKIVRVNGVENCIYLMQHVNHGCADVHPRMPERHQLDLLREMNEDGQQEALTMPMCHRSAREAWNTAANLLEALAQAARDQAAKASKACTFGLDAKPKTRRLKLKTKAKK